LKDGIHIFSRYPSRESENHYRAAEQTDFTGDATLA
jgi:hypothetical protein